MPYVDLDLPPGQFRNGTVRQAEGRWFDANLIRWSQDAMGAVGGWSPLIASSEPVRLGVSALQANENTSIATGAVSTSDAAALDVTGDIDIRSVIEIPSVSSGGLFLVYKRQNLTDGYNFLIVGSPSGDFLRFVWESASADEVAQADAAVDEPDGTIVALRVTMDVDNGAAGHDVTFYKKTTTPHDAYVDMQADSGWTQIGTVQTGAGTTDIQAGVDDLLCNHPVSMAGLTTMYAAEVQDGIEGTVVFSADFTDLAPGDTSFTESSAQAATVTVETGGAVVVTDETPVLGMFAWIDNDGDSWLILGTADKLWAYSEGGLTDITPAGFTGGGNLATTTIGTYGTGSYGVGAYGGGDPTQATLVEAQSWQFDSFGETPLAVALSDGKVYSWDLDTGNLAVVADADIPTDVVGVVVTPERFVVVLGGDSDPRKVEWSDQEDLTTWTEGAGGAGDSSGSFSLAGTGELLMGRRGRGETLLWTTTDCFAMRFIGGTLLIYAFEQVGSNCGPISRRAVAMVDGGRAYWMGHDSFYAYSGTVQPIPCEVQDHVFKDMNPLQTSRVHAYPITSQGEVWWHYMSANSEVIDRYVCYNYRENTWATGTLDRTAGVDAGEFSTPILADSTGSVWRHETGDTYEDANGNLIVPFAESGPFEIGNGDRFAFIREYIPDGLSVGGVTMKLFTSQYPTTDETEVGPFSLANPTTLRASGRQVRVRVDQVEPGWRMGIPRFDVVPGEGR